VSDARLQRAFGAIVAASIRPRRTAPRLFSKLFVEDEPMNRILSDAEKAALSSRYKAAAERAAESAGVIGVDHLIDACGTDQHKLAGLALLLATAAYGFGIMGRKDENTLDQIRVFQRATVEIEKRVNWELHR
jgi:hypothetical protein